MSVLESSIQIPRIRDLRVVQEVYRHRRIGSAAEFAHISQPAATQALLRVESALGASLFDRHSTGVSPTEVGNIFQKRLNRVLDYLQMGDRLARSKAARTEGRGMGETFYQQCSPTHLRTLVAVSSAGSFSQAARNLGVKQPGLHRAARDLSILAGTELFLQSGGRTSLTPAADAFLRHVKLANGEFRQSQFEINEFLGARSTKINVGSMPLSRTSILPESIARLTEEVGAAVQINCVDARYESLLNDIRSGDMDFLLGALRRPVPANDIKQETLIRDRLVVIAAPTHPLSSKGQVSLTETLEYPWVAPPKNTPTGAYLFNALGIEELDVTPVRVVSSSLVLLRSLLSHGRFISIASERQIHVEAALGALVKLPIDLPGSEREIGLTFRADWLPTRHQKRFLDIIRRVATDSTTVTCHNNFE